jgi:cytochrome c
MVLHGASVTYWMLCSQAVCVTVRLRSLSYRRTACEHLCNFASMEKGIIDVISTQCPLIFKLSVFGWLAFSVLACSGPAKEPQRKKIDRIRAIPGKSDSIPLKVAQTGEVLIGYSDCWTCHKMEKPSAGPAFRDIAMRYPVQERYINMLAGKVMVGGSGAWGTSVMNPHPEVSFDDARVMVSFILSLRD